ncbi:peptidase M3 family protein, partial [Vibrio parahaemolyticus V-223/04]
CLTLSARYINLAMMS